MRRYSLANEGWQATRTSRRGRGANRGLSTGTPNVVCPACTTCTLCRTADDPAALRTGRKDFLETACKLADKFFELLPESGVPWW